MIMLIQCTKMETYDFELTARSLQNMGMDKNEETRFYNIFDCISDIVYWFTYLFLPWRTGILIVSADIIAQNSETHTLLTFWIKLIAHSARHLSKGIRYGHQNY